MMHQHLALVRCDGTRTVLSACECDDLRRSTKDGCDLRHGSSMRLCEPMHADEPCDDAYNVNPVHPESFRSIYRPVLVKLGPLVEAYSTPYNARLRDRLGVTVPPLYSYNLQDSYSTSIIVATHSYDGLCARCTHVEARTYSTVCSKPCARAHGMHVYRINTAARTSAPHANVADCSAGTQGPPRSPGSRCPRRAAHGGGTFLGWPNRWVDGDMLPGDGWLYCAVDCLPSRAFCQRPFGVDT